MKGATETGILVEKDLRERERERGKEEGRGGAGGEYRESKGGSRKQKKGREKNI